MTPRVEELIAFKLLGQLPADEETTRMALDPAPVFDLHYAASAHAALSVLSRSASVFVFDWEDVGDAVLTAPEFARDLRGTGSGLPPLPFPRVCVEFQNGGVPIDFFSPAAVLDRGSPYEPDTHGFGPDGFDDAFKSLTSDVFSQMQSHGMRLQLVTISEKVQGNEWYAVFTFTDSDGAALYAHLIAVTPDRGYGPDLGGAVKDGVSIFDRLPLTDTWGTYWSIAVMLGHLLTAQGMKTEPVKVPRGTSRSHERRYKVAHPSVYFVTSGGEHDPDGEANWHYTCRFLVRGHWRRTELGSTHVADKGGLCSWVRPYVKGPAAAPWKGRPVHVEVTS